MEITKYLQFQGKELEIDSLEKEVKGIWKKQGKLLKDIKALKLYIKVEEGMCYYIINDTYNGSFSIE